MNILGIGPMELVLIGVLALIVFGPARLPEIMGQVGRTIAEFRRATSTLSDEFNRTIAAELQETKAVIEETKSVVTDTRASLQEAHASLTTLPAPQRVAAPDVPLATNGTHTPPMADTSQWSWEGSSPPSATSEPVIAPPSEPSPRRAEKPLRDELLPPY
jgi:Tat protein translocase TatB subunit